MKKKLLRSLIGLMAIGLLVTGCGSDKSGAKQAESTKPQEEFITIKDQQQEEVKIKKDLTSVVVFDMGSLDTMDELGEGSKVVGVPTQNLPNYLKSYDKTESVGGIKEPDLEKINQLQPDLIIISGRQEDFKEQLSRIAPTIYLGVDSTRVFQSTSENIQTIGKIFGKEQQAKKEISQLETAIQQVKQQAEKSNRRTLMTLVNEGKLSAFGEGSRFAIVHDTFGFKQADDKIEASTHGQSVSYEYVLDQNPDVIFVVDRTKAIGGDDSHNHVAENELVKQTVAGKENRVISLQPDVWYLSGGGLQSTKLMLDDVKKGLE